MGEGHNFKKEALTRPFSESLIKVNRYKSFKPRYVEAGHYIKALNEATDHRWNVEILSEEIVHKFLRSGPDQKQPFFVVKIRLTIPDEGIVKETYGGSSLVGDDPEDSRKAAETDAIKKACWMLGIGVDISIDPPEPRQPGDPPEPRQPPDPPVPPPMAPDDMPTQQQWETLYHLMGYPPEEVSDPEVKKEYKVQFMKKIGELSMKNFRIHWKLISKGQADTMIGLLRNEGKNGQAG
jgi:hypothetical protein